MRPYETMVIFGVDLEEEAIRGAIAKALDVVKAHGGEPGSIDYWGRRRFAYELKHRWEGYYVVFQAKAPPTMVAELDRFLSLSDEVIRHRVVTIPPAQYGKTRPPAPSES